MAPGGRRASASCHLLRTPATSDRSRRDLGRPDGALVLVSATGGIESFDKTYELYGSPPAGSDDAYYLNLTKSAAVGSPVDILGAKLLSGNYSGVTWDLVASAVPPIQRAGVRSFVGSRAAVVDTTFNDAGEDAAGYGFPAPVEYVFNLTRIANGGGPVDPRDYVNSSRMADGLVGGHLPITVVYFELNNGTSYWTMVASPEPDMHGSREQTVWFRFQHIACSGAGLAPPCAAAGPAQYFDTYWWTRRPGNSHSDASMVSGFYSSLLANRRWWGRELAREGMMALDLPSQSTSTNGTRLFTQLTHQVIMGMIVWHDTWGPRYGVLPGYGIQMQNGFEDTFTATAMAALEIGALPYAQGLIANQWRHYVREDGMIRYRAEEVAQQARMLTILALYHSYTGDAELLLDSFDKAQIMAEWLIARRATALQFARDDPRYGIPAGNDEGDDFKYFMVHQQPTSHWYSSAAETYRAFVELGTAWAQIGAAHSRADVKAHGEKLLALAPLLYRDLHASLNRTASTSKLGHRCHPHRADGAGTFQGCPFRSYPELFYSGAITAEQTNAMYVSGQGLTDCEVGRWLTMGSPSGGGTGSALIFVHVSRHPPPALHAACSPAPSLLHTRSPRGCRLACWCTTWLSGSCFTSSPNRPIPRVVAAGLRPSLRRLTATAADTPLHRPG